LKALTLKHPWPYAVCRLGKDIENRTWHPGRKLPVDEWFAIHGGVYPKGQAWDEAMSDLHSLQVRGLALNALKLGETILPGVVAVCRFGGAVSSSASVWFNGPVGWVLTETVVLPEPVPCKGQQGLWDLPEDVLAKVREGFAIARKRKEEAASA
jgi:hypothetical protein